MLSARAGTHGGIKLGNTTLVDYGIQTEESDLRVHVCVSVGAVYVYQTSDGVKAVESGLWRKVPVYTGTLKTAEGFLVPPDRIEGCNMKQIPEDIGIVFYKHDNTSEKGRKALEVVRSMMRRGLMPIPLMAREIDDTEMQIQGTDIIATSDANVQVKCDWRGGHKELGGTGNLFLQVSECNPLGMH